MVDRRSGTEIMKLQQALPDVRGDKLELGWTATLKGRGKLSIAVFEDILRSIGEVTTPASRRNDGYTQLSRDLTTERGDPAGVLRLEMHFRRSGDDLEFGNRCSIRINGMDVLRGELGPEKCGLLSLDGKTNVLGNEHRGADLTALQLDLLEQAIQNLLEVLSEAFGEGWRPGRLWLKSGEACRDITTSNAIADVRVIQHAVLVGTVERRWDEYRRVGGSETDGIPVLRFVRHANGPVDKIYPKREDTRRVEVACPSRLSVVALTGAARSTFTAADGKELILHFLTAAGPRLDAIDAFISRALTGEASVVHLLLLLKPLVDRAAGERKGKGPASPEAQQVATRALDALLSVGIFDAGGLHARHAIRRELDALCNPDGPLERHPKRAIYYLSARFARACAVMRGEEPR